MFERESLIAKYRKMIDDGVPIIGGGAGLGPVEMSDQVPATQQGCGCHHGHGGLGLPAKALRFWSLRLRFHRAFQIPERFSAGIHAIRTPAGSTASSIGASPGVVTMRPSAV